MPNHITILNLQHWSILETKENDNDYRISAEYEELPKYCEHCLSETFSRNGTRTALFMDLPIHGKRVGIEVIRQRYICNACRKSFSQRLPDIDDKRDATKRLVKFIQEQSLRRTFASIADEVGVAENTVKNIFDEYVEQLEKDHVSETPIWLGIDEIHIIKKPRCVISDVRNRRIFDILINRNKPTVAKRIWRLEASKVELVTMDMWSPYKDVAESLLKHAPIIIDKFHVLRMMNEVLEKMRKEIRKELPPKIRRKLVKDRFILLTRHHKLDEFEKLILETWTNEFPKLAEIYWLKESFFAIYESADKFEAKEHYRNWLMGIPKDIEPYFETMLKSLTNWEKEIFAYFDHSPRVTNAYTESLNNLIRHVNRNGRGYSFDALRAKLLYGTGASKYRREVYQRKNWNPNIDILYSMVPKEVENYYLGSDISTLIELYEKGTI